MSHKKKSEQLGISYGKAKHKLMKNILFSLIQKLNLDICYRCNKKIETIRQLSVDHKVPWLDSADPPKLFFDLENISFSHLSCNSSHHEVNIEACKRAGGTNRIISPDGYERCSICKETKKVDEFYRDKHNCRGRDYFCIICRKKHKESYIPKSVV